MLIPHERRKLRLRPDDLALRLIRSWVSAGAPNDVAELPKLVGIEVAPGPETVIAPLRRAQLAVTAHDLPTDE